ncbi:MAG TPA: argininosuccinate lyase [bacterium]
MTEFGGPGAGESGGHRMWGGRFTEPTDPRILEFTASFGTDRRLLEWDLIGSIAHATMLGETGILPPGDAHRIVAGLRGIAADVRDGRVAVGGPFEDVHSFIEATLYERIGPAAGGLHTARSRNDQVATAFRLWVKDAAATLAGTIVALMSALRSRAAETAGVILPAFTHLQHAQPVRLGHYLLAQFWALERDVDRLADCYRRADVLPLGAGAIAGVSYPIDRARAAELLGFAAVTDNSIDAVGDRDFAVDLAAAVALLMVHLSRWGNDLVLWASDEFGFIRLADRIATGSSIMPQKKNPDAAELIRGRAGRALGALVALLDVLKGLPAGYNSDLQEDKDIIFGTVDLATASVRTMGVLLDGLTFDEQRMREAAARGLITATEVADYLTRKGLPFRDAHRLAGDVVRAAAGRHCQIYDLPLDAFRQVSPLFESDILDAVTLEAAVEAKDVPGGTGARVLREQLEAAQRRQGAREQWCRSASAAAGRGRGLLQEV